MNVLAFFVTVENNKSIEETFPPQMNIIPLKQRLAEGRITLLDNIKVNWTPWQDSIAVRVLKKVKSQICKILSIIFDVTKFR